MIIKSLQTAIRSRLIVLKDRVPTQQRRQDQRPSQSSQEWESNINHSKSNSLINHFIQFHRKIRWLKIPLWPPNSHYQILIRKDWQEEAKNIETVVIRLTLQILSRIHWDQVQMTIFCTSPNKLCHLKKWKFRTAHLKSQRQFKERSIIKKVNLMEQVSSTCSWVKQNSWRKQKLP